MALSDYSHHNEEAQAIWWEEEGKHEPSEPFDIDWEMDGREFDPCADCECEEECLG